MKTKQYHPTFDECCSHPAIKKIIEQRDELLATAKSVSIRDFTHKNDYGISSDTMHKVRTAIQNCNP